MAGYTLAKFSFREINCGFYDFSGFNDSWTNHLDTIFNFKTFGLVEFISRINCAKYCECNVHIYDTTIFYNLQELEEAAALDGLGSLETFFQIVLPLAKPALAAQNNILWVHGITFNAIDYYV